MKLLAAIILIVSAARAAQTNWPAARADGKAKPEKVKVEKFKVKAEKQKGGKTERREFPLMFDIADRSQKHKAAKHKKAKQKGDK
jgi:hypothetical protein